VHDKRAVALLEIEELVANPIKIMQGLLRQRNSRTQSRVNEKKVAAGKAVLKTIQKDTMRFRKKIDQAAVNAELGCIEISTRQAIGFKCLPASDIKPGMKSGRIGEKSFQQRLMIATQTDSALLSDAPCQRFDHFFRMGTAVDIIADIDFDRSSYRATGPIIVNSLNDLAQQIGAPVNVAYGIDSCIGRKGRV